MLFDPADPEQVKEFQRGHGLEPDGVIGPRTQGALAAVVRDRELDDLLQALGRGQTKSRSELREAVHARRWGPGRFRYVLASAEEQGLVRRVGLDQSARAG